MKKFLSLVLALLMLALPTLSLADTDFVGDAVSSGRRADTTITVHSLNQQLMTMLLGADAEVLTMVNDVLAAVSLSTYVQDEEAGLAFNMQQTPVVTLNVGVEDDALLLGTNLLGEKALAFTSPDQIKAVIERLLRTFKDDLGLTDADIDQVMASFSMEVNMEEVAEVLSVVEELDFSPFIALVIGWAAKVQTGEVTEQPTDCDIADAVTTLTLTAEDMNALMPALVEFIDKNPAIGESFIQGFEESGLTWEENKSDLANAAIFAGDTEIVAYTWADELVKLTVSTTLGDAETQLPIYVVYTLKDGLSTTAANFANMMQLAIAYQEEEAETEAASALSVQMSVMQDGAAITFGVNVNSASATDGTDAQSQTDMTITLLGMDIITLTIATVTGETQEPALSLENAVDLAALTDEDFQLWCQNVAASAMNALTQGIMLLPASVLTQLMAQ